MEYRLILRTHPHYHPHTLWSLYQNPEDEMAYNNRGNANAGLRKWLEAIANYKKFAEVAPNFAFARANYALALYKTDKVDEAVHHMRNILTLPMYAPPSPQPIGYRENKVKRKVTGHQQLD